MARRLKEALAAAMLENLLLKKCVIADRYVVEHLLGALIERPLALLFDLAVAAAIVGAYVGFVFLLCAGIKALIDQF